MSNSGSGTILAKDLVKEVTDPSQTTLFDLSDKTIEGCMDLSHQVVFRPIKINNCHFVDKVNLRHTEFKHAVDFSGCTFHKSFDSGDSEESYAIYSKDLIAINATFLVEARFAGSQFLASANLVGCRFEATDQDADLRGCQFGKFLILRRAVFQGGARFEGIECGANAYFEETRFENPSKLVDFSSSSFGRSLEFTGAIFKGGASFNSLHCKTSGNFERVQFENPTHDIDFRHASFELVLDCSKACFKGGADFNAVAAVGAFFHDTQFLNATERVDMGYVDFTKNLQCRGAKFAGPVSFNSACIGDTLLLEKAQFENGVYLHNTKTRHLEVRAAPLLLRASMSVAASLRRSTMQKNRAKNS